MERVLAESYTVSMGTPIFTDISFPIESDDPIAHAYAGLEQAPVSGDGQDFGALAGNGAKQCRHAGGRRDAPSAREMDYAALRFG